MRVGVRMRMGLGSGAQASDLELGCERKAIVIVESLSGGVMRRAHTCAARRSSASKLREKEAHRSALGGLRRWLPPVHLLEQWQARRVVAACHRGRYLHEISRVAAQDKTHRPATELTATGWGAACAHRPAG